jgi:predicted dehydrogenase
MTTFRVAVIGAGNMGRHHANTVAAASGSELTLVVDRHPDRARELAETVGARWSTDVTDALDVDAAIVATSTDSHTGILVTLIEAGIPTLVEKPLSSNFEEVASVISASRGNGTSLACGFVERFSSAVAPTRTFAMNDATSFTSHRLSPPVARASSGVVDDQMIHDLDLLLQWWKGDPIIHVRAVPDQDELIGNADATASCEILFGSGRRAIAVVSRSAPHKRRTITLDSATRRETMDLLVHDGLAMRRQWAHFVSLAGEGTTLEREAERSFIADTHHLVHMVKAAVQQP